MRRCISKSGYSPEHALTHLEVGSIAQEVGVARESTHLLLPVPGSRACPLRCLLGSRLDVRPVGALVDFGELRLVDIAATVCMHHAV